MNAELQRIRENLRCAHCESVFVGSESQARKVKYESAIVYCSAVCRAAAARNRYSKPLPNRGPCKTCGKEFFSRTSKHFCDIKCYTQSKQFGQLLAEARNKSLSKEARSKIAAKLKKGGEIPCPECGTQVYRKPSDRRRFCCKPCYRSYLAKRFDRWIANPEGMALPQCYDEFLDREELTCVIDGCSWRGRHLTLHVNQAHGLRSDEFKRAVGFNLSTGIVSKSLAEQMSERAKVGIASIDYSGPLPDHGKVNRGIRYWSKEGSEHLRKSRALAGPGPQHQCKGCRILFTQRTPFGRAVYCTPTCRDAHYAEQKKIVKCQSAISNG